MLNIGPNCYSSHYLQATLLSYNDQTWPIRWRLRRCWLIRLMNRNMISRGLTFRLVVSHRPSFEVLDWCIGRYEFIKKTCHLSTYFLSLISYSVLFLPASFTLQATKIDKFACRIVCSQKPQVLRPRHIICCFLSLARGMAASPSRDCPHKRQTK